MKTNARKTRVSQRNGLNKTVGVGKQRVFSKNKNKTNVLISQKGGRSGYAFIKQPKNSNGLIRKNKSESGVVVLRTSRNSILRRNKDE